MKKLLRYILGIFFVCTPQILFADFVIFSALSSTLDDSNLEYIEILNFSTQTGSLEGYTLSDKSSKEYNIPEVILGPGEKHQFLRPETKLILNNTNEEIFLKNPLGEIEDEVSYTTSEKGVPLEFFDIEQEFFSDEAAMIPLYYSSEAPIEEKIVIILPEVSWEFQQPSYILEKEILSDIYFCDPEKEACKVNLNFLPSFTGDIKITDFVCETDFGFISGEENRCNPNTIEFPEGVFDIQIKIVSKDDRTQFVEKYFQIDNRRESEEQIQTSGGEEIANSVNEQDQTQNDPEDHTEKVVLPEILYSFQQPSYVITSRENSYVCDRSKEICRINLDLRQSFSDGFSESDFLCEIDFGFESTETQKCNPGTIDIPTGNHSFLIKIFSKQDVTQFVEKYIYLENEGYSPLAKVTSQKLPKNFLELEKPEIIIQSGLTENERKYTCTGKTCKVNLEYDKKHKDERCVWDFGDGVHSESTATRCNPGYVTYEEGRHAITLKVYQNKNTSNYRESRIAFDFFLESKQVLEDILMQDISESKYEITDSQIILQGKIGKDKTLTKNTLKCEVKEFCSVNFEGKLETSQDTENLAFLWDFGDGTTSERQNPLSHQYAFGQYTVVFSVFLGELLLSQKEFFVSVIPIPETLKKSSKTQQEEILFVFTGSLQIVSLLSNPQGNDIREWIEIKNTGAETSLYGCYLKRGTKKYTFSEDYFLTSGEIKKVFRVFSGLTLGNSSGELELFCGERLMDSVVWDRKIPEGVVLFSDDFSQFQNYQISHTDFIDTQNYTDFVEKTFYTNIRILKSGVKITGQTLASTSIQISSSQGHTKTLFSDADGLFEILLDTGFTPGEVFLSFSFTDILENEFLFQSDSVSISQADISNFFAKYIKKLKKISPKKTVIPEFLISSDFPEQQDSAPELSVGQKILALLGVTLLGALLFFVIAYKRHFPNSSFDIGDGEDVFNAGYFGNFGASQIALVHFQTRGKILLLV